VATEIELFESGMHCKSQPFLWRVRYFRGV